MFGINEFSYQNNCIGSWIWWHEIFLMIAVSKLDEVRWNVWLKVSNEGKWKKDLYAWNWSAHITQRTLLMVGNCVSPAWRIEHTWIYILYKYLRWWTYSYISSYVSAGSFKSHIQCHREQLRILFVHVGVPGPRIPPIPSRCIRWVSLSEKNTSGWICRFDERYI